MDAPESGTPSPAAHEGPGRARSLILRGGLSLLLGGFLFWLLQRADLPFVPPPDAWQRLQAGGALAFVGLWFVSTFLRTWRWVHLLRPIEPKVSPIRTFAVGLVGYAALFAPMRMGELARPVLVSRDKQVGFVQAGGTVIAERIVDGLLLTLLLVLGLSVAPPVPTLPSEVERMKIPVAEAVRAVPAVAWGALTLFVSAFLAMTLFYFWRATARKLAFAVVGVVSKPLAEAVTGHVERLSDSLSFLFSAKHGFAFLRDTLAYWLVSGAAFMLLLRAVGAPASLAQALVLIGVLGLGTALPGPPGFFGTYHLGCYCGIALYYPKLLLSGEAALFTFIGFVTQTSIAVIALVVGLWTLSSTAKPAVAATPAQPAEPLLRKSS